MKIGFNLVSLARIATDFAYLAHKSINSVTGVNKPYCFPVKKKVNISWKKHKPKQRAFVFILLHFIYFQNGKIVQISICFAGGVESNAWMQARNTITVRSLSQKINFYRILFFFQRREKKIEQTGEKLLFMIIWK